MISEMKKIKILGFFGLGILVGLVLLIGIARLTWHSKFYPGVSIAGVSVSGLTREQARVKLTEMTDNYRVKLTFNGSEWEAPKKAVEFEIEATLNTAYHYGRRAKLGDYLLLLINRKTDYPLLLSEGKTEKLEGLISEVAGVVEIVPIDPIVEVVGNKVKITNGIGGVIMVGEELDRRIKDGYANLNHKEIVIPTQVVRRELSQDELAQQKTRRKP
jgi:hypothetical protein